LSAEVIRCGCVIVVTAMTKPLAPLGRGAVMMLVAGLCACRGADASRESASNAAPSSFSTANLPVTPPLPGDNDPAPVSPAPIPMARSLPDQLGHEAASRPAGAVRGEQLVTSLQGHGIAIARTRQVLGKTLNARYCAIAVTEAGLVASVCEFDTPAAATAAIHDSEQRFGKPMPDRRFVTNGKSLLTIGNLSDAAEREARTIATAFAALRAT
jgi:hypothetical protein